MNDLSPAWIGVIGTLAGGLLVGFITFMLRLLDERFQRERDDRKIKLEKLEELIVRVATFRRDVSIYSDRLSRNTIDQDTAKEQFERIKEMLPWLDAFISIYANEAVTIWVEVRNKLIVFESSAEQYWSKGTTDGNLRRNFNEFDRKCLKLQHDLIMRIPTL